MMDARKSPAERALPTPVLPLLAALLVCDAPAVELPVADDAILVGVSAAIVALAGLTLFDVDDWLGTLTALPLALPETHFTTSSLCSRK